MGILNKQVNLYVPVRERLEAIGFFRRDDDISDRDIMIYRRSTGGRIWVVWEEGRGCGSMEVRTGSIFGPTVLDKAFTNPDELVATAKKYKYKHGW